ncbi:hypothetical protein RRG08_058565 [Elysia crispata]|uniref:Uncharacterized protein n=1 Tax=Elysia crispata TaxID=231223 RepID=A0AAE0XUF2_9GAST|nr:hypothetical protein RRG08_058565 [Elysia crispata]
MNFCQWNTLGLWSSFLHSNPAPSAVLSLCECFWRHLKSLHFPVFIADGGTWGTLCSLKLWSNSLPRPNYFLIGPMRHRVIFKFRFPHNSGCSVQKVIRCCSHCACKLCGCEEFVKFLDAEKARLVHAYQMVLIHVHDCSKVKRSSPLRAINSFLSVQRLAAKGRPSYEVKQCHA